MSQFTIKISDFGHNNMFPEVGELDQTKRAMMKAATWAISNVISQTTTSPLEVIKIRFQVQVESITSWTLLHKDLWAPSKYTGVHQAAKDIFREEALAGFWRGNVPALLKVMPYAAIQLTAFQKLKTLVTSSSNSKNHKNLSPSISFVIGGLARCVGTIGSHPFDHLKTVLAFQGEPKVFLNMRSAIIEIAQSHCFLGFYAGLQPTLVGIFLHAGLQFGTYNMCKQWTKLSNVQLWAGAARFAKLACHPLDAIARILRHSKYGALIEYCAYRNIFEGVRQILKLKGVAGLYKGVVPSVLKVAPAGAIMFVAYEGVLELVVE